MIRFNAGKKSFDRSLDPAADRSPVNNPDMNMIPALAGHPERRYMSTGSTELGWMYVSVY